MSLFNLLITAFMAFAITFGFSLLKRKYSLVSNTALIVIGVFVFSFNSLPAQAMPNLAALGAKDNAIHQQQQSLEEDLKLTPGGGHYSGIEYAQRSASESSPLSDETIKQSIEPYTSDNLIVSVANGAVRLSGRVEDKEVARHIVEEIKEIPGVHEITFNLGLED